MDLKEKAKQARAEYMRNWRLKNKEHHSEYMKAYRQSHKKDIQRNNKTYWDKIAAAQ